MSADKSPHCSAHDEWQPDYETLHVDPMPGAMMPTMFQILVMTR